MIRGYVLQRRAEILDLLSDFVAESSDRLAHIGPWVDDLCRRLLSFTGGGKMLRGALVGLGYDLFAGEGRQKSLPAAAAMELIQSFLLIHDDIMDRDSARRGAASVYAQYQDHGLQTGAQDPLHFGYSMAICGGDVAMLFAYRLLGRVDSPRLPVIFDLVSDEISKTGFAQMSDVANGQLVTDPGAEEILTVYRYKTGRYTVSLPLAVGALVAGADDSAVRVLLSAGEELGVVFQLVDDRIGLFGASEVTGKPVGSDIAENKKTLIRHLLFDRARDQDLETLKARFGASDGPEAVHAVRQVYQGLNLDAAVEEVIEDHLRRYRGLLQELPLREPALLLLEDFVAYNTTRSF